MPNDIRKIQNNLVAEIKFIIAYVYNDNQNKQVSKLGTTEKKPANQ